MQQGGSQYGFPPPPPPPPETASPIFSTIGSGTRTHIPGGISGPDHHQKHQQQMTAEAVSPISTRPPPAPAAKSLNFNELAPTVSGSHPVDEEAVAAGEEAERGPPGIRWPRDETLALIEIRTAMDATFRDATLKGPLWEEVSRKLAVMGYTRSAKKCKEKFENVHKYYKRTKDGRAGRQDGKSYRFFSQLEALNTTAAANCSSPAPAPLTSPPASALTSPPAAAIAAPAPVSAAAPRLIQPNIPISSVPSPRSGFDIAAPTAAEAADDIMSFSTNTSYSSDQESDGEDTEETPLGQEGKKRKRAGGAGKTMAFFKDLVKQIQKLMERQEAMQQLFLDAIEKREQERTGREEAWKRQEMARIAREREMMAQEHAMSASRDIAIISFLQKITGQTVQLPAPIPLATITPPLQPAAIPPPPQNPPPPSHQEPPPPQQQQSMPQPSPHKQQRPTTNYQFSEVVSTSRPPSTATELVAVAVQEQPHGHGGIEGGIVSTDPASSRWPKSEVNALISLRSGMESKYQDSGPKGPLWEEMSAGMKRMGYNRSAKRCKEKWENINKYFKKVKESNKRRPDDAKTCTYFHQLEALHRKKNVVATGAGSGSSEDQNKRHGQQTNPCSHDVLPLTALPPLQLAQDHDTENNSRGDINGGGNFASGNGNGNRGRPSCNGDMRPAYFEEGPGTAAEGNKPAGDNVKERVMAEQHEQQAAIDDYDNSDNMDDDQTDDGDDEDDEERQKMAYKIEFQTTKVGRNSIAGGNPSSEAATVNSFLAMPMVQ